MFQVENYAKQYGFLFFGFKEKVFYWELIVMGRKLIVIFGVQFLSSVSSEVQVLVAILIIICSIFIIIKIKPFTNARTNFNNIYSQAIQMLMMYVGLFYMTGHEQAYMNSDSSIHWILMPINILPSVYFFFEWGRRTVEVCLNLLEFHFSDHYDFYNARPNIFRALLCIVSCGKKNLKQFEQEYMPKPIEAICSHDNGQTSEFSSADDKSLGIGLFNNSSR